MKATEKQKQICGLIIEQVDFWKNSNDINSPTHYCDNSERVINIGLLEDDEKDLINFLDNLLDCIKRIK